MGTGRMSRSAFVGAVAVNVAVAVIVAACAGPSDDVAGEPTTAATDAESAPATDPPTASTSASGERIASDGFEPTLEKTAVEAFDTFRFVGLGDQLDGDQIARLSAVAQFDGSGRFPLRLSLEQVDPDASIDVIATVPMNPMQPALGGELVVVLAIGDDQVGAWDVDVAPLPASPGAWEATIDRVRDLIADRAAERDADLEQLADRDPATLPPELQQLAITDAYLDVGASAIASDLTDDERVALDAIVARVGPEQLFEFYLDGAPPIAAEIRSFAGRAVGRQGAVCLDVDYQIDDAETLAAAMGDIRAAEGSASRKLIADVDALMAQLQYLSVIPQVDAVITAFTTLFSVLTQASSFYSGTLPSRLASIDAEVSIDRFNEDFEERGEVTEVLVSAISEGFETDEAFDLLLEGVLSSTGPPGMPEPGSDVDDSFKLPTKKELLTDGAKIATEKLVELAIEELLLDIEVPDVCPNEWVVDLAADENVAADYVDLISADGALDVDEVSLGFEPTEVGTANLEVRTDRDAFESVVVATEVPIETVAIQVLADPPDVFVNSPGEVVRLTAETVNADDPVRRWDAAAGSLAPVDRTDAARSQTVAHTSSGDRADYPYAIDVHSASTSGLRVEGAEPRFDTVWVQVAPFEVAPGDALLQGGERIDFRATDTDGSPVDVTWETNGGTIDANGGYTAPDQPGVYTVTARLASDPSVFVSVTVEVVGGDCLVGTWVLRSEEFFELMGGGLGEFRGGEYRIEIAANGTFRTVKDAWSYVVDAGSARIIVEQSGSTTGTWVVEDEVITVEDQGGDVTVTQTVEGNATIPVPNAHRTFNDALNGSLDYDCEGDVWTMAAGDRAIHLDRADDG